MKRIAIAVFVLCVVCCGVGSRPARSTGLIAGATEPTQILNHIELLLQYVEDAQQTIHQYTMVLQGIENLKRQFTGAALESEIRRLFSDYRMLDSFRKLRQMYVAGQQISYSFANFESVFKQAYPEYAKQAVLGRDFEREYGDWSRTTRSMIQEAMKVSGLQEESFESEGEMINELSNATNNVRGITQAVQAGNMAAIATASQLQKLRELQMAQSKVQNAFLMQQHAESERGREVEKQQGNFPWTKYQKW